LRGGQTIVEEEGATMRPKPSASVTAAPSDSGIGWRVIIEIDPDRIQYIGGFESEKAARDWISHQSRNWLKRLSSGL
jgi:hypothetical protein